MLRTESFANDSAVSKEIQKGYGLLVLGIAKTEAAQGEFHEEIARIAAMYEGPLAVVIARGPKVDLAREGALNILVPVRGNKVSRRAAEVAVAIAKMNNSPMTALYVLGTIGLGAAQRRLRRPTRTHHYEEAVLKDIVELADREGRLIRTALRLDVSPEDAILRQARLGRYNLIVLGVGRPAGEALFLAKLQRQYSRIPIARSFLYRVESPFLAPSCGWDMSAISAAVRGKRRYLANRSKNGAK
jgi:nucleotide-binding universal stress UspA family protein